MTSVLKCESHLDRYARPASVMRLTFGIDPGLSGAVAVLADGEFRDVFDMPTVGRGAKGRQTVNAVSLAAALREHVSAEPGASVLAVLEEVSAMPGQGVTSMFRFGQSVGAVEGVLAALRMPLVRVRPQEWKKHAGLSGTAKDVARGLAIDLYPAAPLYRVRDGGRADALLLARWAWQTEQGGK
jgi:crossover junction endodeoxyribonuclease RuvC